MEPLDIGNIRFHIGVAEDRPDQLYVATHVLSFKGNGYISASFFADLEREDYLKLGRYCLAHAEEMGDRPIPELKSLTCKVATFTAPELTKEASDNV
jgi:hypothetical protein